MLIVVPTDQQRSQYIEGLREDLIMLGLPSREIQRCDNQAGWVIKECHQNTSEIFIAGVQSISSNPGYYADLMSKGRWLVVADEFHHYGDENTWGKSIKELPCEVIMGMSATPIRADEQPTIFGDLNFDVSVSVKDAYEEGAVKRIEARIGDYFVSFSSQEDPEPQNYMMSDMVNIWGKTDGTTSSISAYEIKKGIRYHDKYVSEIFLQVLSLWNEYESKWPGQNQILVFAMSCRHAEMVTNLINDIAFPGYPSPFADWIGVGEGLVGARTDKENADILTRFQDNKLPCLVQVNKAGEGFNNKRCSIGLFLDLVGDTPMKRQHIGRFMRVNPKALDQASVIFVSEDSPARTVLEDIESAFKPKDDETGPATKPGGGGGGGKDGSIPDVFIIDTQFESERIVYPYGSPEKAMAKYLEKAPIHVRDIYDKISPDDAMAIFKEEVEKWLKEEQRKREPVLTEEQKRKQVSEQVKRNTGMLAAIVAKKRYGKSAQKSVMGDLMRLINSQWKRKYSGHSDMTIEDLKSKNQWLQSIAEEVQEKGIPTWLNL